MTALDVEKDAGTLSNWTNSYEFVRNHLEGFYRLYTEFEIKKLFKEKLKKADESKLDYYFVIRENDSENMIGLLHFGTINFSHQTSFFTMDLPEQDNLEKYGSEVLQMAMRYAFMELSLHRLWSTIVSFNESKANLFEAVGFLRETQRREGVFFNGKYHDELCYSTLRHEWKKKYLEESR